MHFAHHQGGFWIAAYKGVHLLDLLENMKALAGHPLSETLAIDVAGLGVGCRMKRFPARG